MEEGEGGGKDELSRRRSAFSGRGEKRKVVVGGERKKGGRGEKGGEKEREREKLCGIRTVFLDGARNILASSLLFENKKKKGINKEFFFLFFSPCLSL